MQHNAMNAYHPSSPLWHVIGPGSKSFLGGSVGGGPVPWWFVIAMAALLLVATFVLWRMTRSKEPEWNRRHEMAGWGSARKPVAVAVPPVADAPIKSVSKADVEAADSIYGLQLKMHQAYSENNSAFLRGLRCYDPERMRSGFTERAKPKMHVKCGHCSATYDFNKDGQCPGCGSRQVEEPQTHTAVGGMQTIDGMMFIPMYNGMNTEPPPRTSYKILGVF